MRADALQAANAPTILGLAKGGTSSMKAIAGGELGSPTEQPTISGPGWSTILTGTYTNKHGVTGNSTKAGVYHQAVAPHFAKRLRECVATASVSSITSWPWIEDYLIASQPQYLDYHVKGVGETHETGDADVVNKATDYLKSGDPDVLFLHFETVDGAGHGSGFTPENPEYLAAISQVDDLVGQVLEAVKARPRYAKENWLIILTTDHGGNGTAHGGQSPGERTIPMIVAGKGSSARGIVDETPGQHVICGTIFQFLDVPVKPGWGWEPGTFGLR